MLQGLRNAWLGLGKAFTGTPGNSFEGYGGNNTALDIEAGTSLSFLQPSPTASYRVLRRTSSASGSMQTGQPGQAQPAAPHQASPVAPASPASRSARSGPRWGQDQDRRRSFAAQLGSDVPPRPSTAGPTAGDSWQAVVHPTATVITSDTHDVLKVSSPRTPRVGPAGSSRPATTSLAARERRTLPSPRAAVTAATGVSGRGTTAAPTPFPSPLPPPPHGGGAYVHGNTPTTPRLDNGAGGPGAVGQGSPAAQPVGGQQPLPPQKPRLWVLSSPKPKAVPPPPGALGLPPRAPPHQAQAKPTPKGRHHGWAVPAARTGGRGGDDDGASPVQRSAASAITPPLRSSERPSPVPPARIRLSDLTLEHEIAEGGFGKVYAGLWRGERVAVKVARGTCLGGAVAGSGGKGKDGAAAGPPLESPSQRKEVEQFRREVDIMSRIPPHKNIIRLLAACDEPGCLALVTQLCPRGSLYALLHSPDAPPLRLRDLLSIWRGVAEGMQHLHACDPPVLHRDLKSANILLADSLDVKIIDFGLSKTSMPGQAMTGGLGTFQWMAPEVLSAQPYYSVGADIYSFAVIMWECLTRALPYEGMLAVQAALGVSNGGLRPAIPPGTPDDLAQLISACWAPVGDQRPRFGVISRRLELMAATWRAEQLDTVLDCWAPSAQQQQCDSAGTGSGAAAASGTGGTDPRSHSDNAAACGSGEAEPSRSRGPSARSGGSSGGSDGLAGAGGAVSAQRDLPATLQAWQAAMGASHPLSTLAHTDDGPLTHATGYSLLATATSAAARSTSHGAEDGPAGAPCTPTAHATIPPVPTFNPQGTGRSAGAEVEAGQQTPRQGVGVFAWLRPAWMVSSPGDVQDRAGEGSHSGGGGKDAWWDQV